MRRFRRILLVLLAIICALVLGLLAWRALEQAHIAAALRIAAPPGIDELEAVDLGGLPQWISIRGHDRRKPLLLFLHGGPGFPQMPFMKNNALLEEDFVVVQWDERGAGKTFDPDTPGATMNLEQLVGDAHQLVQILRGRFGGQRIFLCAHSYGTLVGALLVAKYPEDFLAYIGISQIADMMAAETQLYHFTLDFAERHGPARVAAELRALGPAPHHATKQLELVKKWCHRFASQLYRQTRPEDLLPQVFVSPQYSLLDCIRLIRGAGFSSDHLWREAYRTNLFQRVPRIDVPVFILAGRHDYAVTATVAHAYFEALIAPRGKKFVWFEDSSHYPNFEEPEKFQEVMVKEVLPIARTPAASSAMHPQRAPNAY